jgi:tRNA nucleotidyltransferase/poly(A) polymerase
MEILRNFKCWLAESIEDKLKNDGQTMNLPKDVLDIAELYKKRDKKLYVVGGAVRDFLLGKTPKDFDLTTECTPDESIEILSPYYKVLEVGKAFGVIKVITQDEPDGYEIATFRSDVGSGRRPDGVIFTSIDKDVLRRDLTVNALFYDIDKKEVVDLVGGIEDLKRGVVRTVGKAEDRFEEDSLRRLRAVRFASKLGSKMDPELHGALEFNSSLKGVSPERIRDEFLKILKSANNVSDAIRMLDDYGMLSQIFPGLITKSDKVSQSFPVATVALILRDNPPEKVEKELNKLAWTTGEVNQIAFLLNLLKLSENTAYELKKKEGLARFYYLEEIEEFAKLAGVDEGLMKSYLKYLPTIKSEDVMAQGFTGPEIGREIRRRESEAFKAILRDI